MNENESDIVRGILEDKGAIRNGHFVLTHGDHSDLYVNCAKVTRHPEALIKICTIMAPYFHQLRPEFFACPSEAANFLTSVMTLVYNRTRLAGAPEAVSLYASKDDRPGAPKGAFYFKREQSEEVDGKHGVVLDDLGTTGESAEEVANLIRFHNGVLDGAAYMCIRGNVTPESVGVPYLYAPLHLALSKYPPDECPLCKAGTPINVKLGHGAKYVQEHGQPVAQG